MKYRHEIDGLRAIAVVTVILFHVGINSFKGGYIGVGVFFVISGYLITSIIIREQKDIPLNYKYRYKIQEVDKYFSSISYERYNVNYLQFEDFYYIPDKGFIEKSFIWRDKDHFSACGEQIISKNAYFFNF